MKGYIVFKHKYFIRMITLSSMIFACAPASQARLSDLIFCYLGNKPARVQIFEDETGSMPPKLMAQLAILGKNQEEITFAQDITIENFSRSNEEISFLGGFDDDGNAVEVVIQGTAGEPQKFRSDAGELIEIKTYQGTITIEVPDKYLVREAADCAVFPPDM